MLANNVQETTTTTGTGNITLAGVSENGRTFTSEFDTNQRFSYFIDDQAGNFEGGVGYLSGASTLVRETPIDGSASLPVNFGAGTKQVFVSEVAGLSPVRNVGVLTGGNQLIKSSHFTRTSTSSGGFTANRLHYVPFILDRPARVVGIGVEVTSAAAASSVAHFALYDMDDTYSPRDRLLSGTNQPVDSTGIAIASVTETYVPAGGYWFAHWSNGSPSYQSVTNFEWATAVQYGGDTSNPERDIVMRFINSQSSLTELANPATQPDNDNWSIGPVLGYLELT